MQQRTISPSPIRGNGPRQAPGSPSFPNGVGTANSMQAFLRAVVLLILALPVLVIVGRQFGLAPFLFATFVLYKLGCLQLLTIIVRWIFVSEGSAYREALRRADTMAQPITTKSSECKENHLLQYGYSCMQGWRRAMEDAHTAILESTGGFFAVFDGHSGSSVAAFCGQNLYRFISKTPAFESKNYSKAMYDGFLSIDRHLHANHSRDRSGCTAVSLYIVGDDLFCANAGDSRCVLCRDGEAIPLSYDHKPYIANEQMRIERAGGYVWNRRVNGILALSRAIGDFMFKSNSQVSWEEQAVTAAPEVKSMKLDRLRDEFAVVACDGIWDVMTNEQVVEFVRPLIAKHVPLVEICDRLMHNCLSPHPFGLGCDNMSVIIILFKKGGGTPTANGGSTTISNNSSSAAIVASMTESTTPSSKIDA